MKTIFLLTCTKSKQEYPCKAEEMYSPSKLFTASFNYALSQVADKEAQIFILSAKYGLLSLSEQISPYDKTLIRMSPAECAEWGNIVNQQMMKAFNIPNTHFVFLAGMAYIDPLKQHLLNYSNPLKGMEMGTRIKWLQDNTPK